MLRDSPDSEAFRTARPHATVHDGVWKFTLPLRSVGSPGTEIRVRTIKNRQGHRLRPNRQRNLPAISNSHAARRPGSQADGDGSLDRDPVISSIDGHLVECGEHLV